MSGDSIEFLTSEEWPSECFDFEMSFDTARSGLLVVDMQNYCINPESDLALGLERHDPALFARYRKRVDDVVESIERLLEAFRANARPVIFTRHGSLLPDGIDLIRRRRSRESISRGASGDRSGHMAAVGTAGHGIIPRLIPLPSELVLDKNTGSAFNSTGIDVHLRNLGVRTLVVAGIATDMCVMLTSLDAADRGWDVYIAADACTTVDPGNHDAFLLNFKRVFGSVTETSEIVDMVERDR